MPLSPPLPRVRQLWLPSETLLASSPAPKRSWRLAAVTEEQKRKREFNLLSSSFGVRGSSLDFFPPKLNLPKKTKSDALISRIAATITERFPKDEEEEKEETNAEGGEATAAASAAAAAAPSVEKKEEAKKKPPPRQKAASVPKRKQPPTSHEKKTKAKKTTTKTKAAAPNALLRTSSRSLSLGDFAAAEAALASGFAGKRRAKKSKADKSGVSAET